MTSAAVLASLPPLRVDGRVDKLRVVMSDQGLDAFVVSGLSSVRWLTGFTGSNAAVVVTPETFTLVTDGRYETQAPAQLADVGCTASVVLDRWLVTGAVGAIGSARRVALEADVVTWSVLQRWQGEISDTVELVPTHRVPAELRAVKDDAELARIAKAASIVDGVLADVESLLVPGVSEREIGTALGQAGGSEGLCPGIGVDVFTDRQMVDFVGGDDEGDLAEAVEIASESSIECHGRMDE